MLDAMSDPKEMAPIFAGRTDLWYIADAERGTLPASLAGLTMAELADAHGVACHAVRAVYTLDRPDGAMLYRGIGLDNHADYLFRVEPGNLHPRFEQTDQFMKTSVETSLGELSWKLHFS